MTPYCDFERLTAGVTCLWAGVDSVWEQEKLEARKMLENAADSHTSGARFVSPFFWVKDVVDIQRALHIPMPSRIVEGK
jgi:hypothetical protein